MTDFTARMEAGKANAAERRARGLATGKAAKGWNVKRPVEAKGTSGRVVGELRAYWDAIKGEAIEAYRWEVRGQYLESSASPGWYDYELIPF